MRACIAMDGRDFLHPLTATFGPIAAIHFLNRNILVDGQSSRKVTPLQYFMTASRGRHVRNCVEK
jgi:hypothetical protein